MRPGGGVAHFDIREISATRAINDSYANGYGTSKWVGEVLLREAHDLCGLPVAVFRCEMILADTSYAGPLLHDYQQPEKPTRGSLAPTDLFRAAVQESKIGPDNDIPRVSAPIVIKYFTDLQLLELL